MVEDKRSVRSVVTSGMEPPCSETWGELPVGVNRLNGLDTDIKCAARTGKVIYVTFYDWNERFLAIASKFIIQAAMS